MNRSEHNVLTESRSALSQPPSLDPVLFREYEEQCYEIDEYEGAIPDFVQGHLLLNGPARFERNGVRYRNWLDGDGMVCSLQFKEGQLLFQNRFVRTAKFEAEARSGEFQYRTFGTTFPNDRLTRGLSTESPANVSVFPFAGRILAFGEQSVPFALNPQSLKTEGPYDFNGSLNSVSPFSAHPKIDPDLGELVNFGISFSARHPVLNYYRFDSCGNLLLRRRVRMDRATSLHDFALSQHYATFYLSPYCLDINKLISGKSSTMESLFWSDSESQLLILDRKTGEEKWRLPIGTGYVLHTVNSFERDGKLIVDVLEMDGPLYECYQLPHLFRDAPVGRPVRYEIRLASGSVSRRELPCLATMDFPCISPMDQMRDYQKFWFLSISPEATAKPRFFDRLVACHWSNPDAIEVYDAGCDRLLAGEPVFVAHPLRAGEGVIICQGYSFHSDSFAFLFFDASSIEAGPIARVVLRSPIHLGFHATFHSSAN